MRCRSGERVAVVSPSGRAPVCVSIALAATDKQQPGAVRCVVVLHDMPAVSLDLDDDSDACSVGAVEQALSTFLQALRRPEIRVVIVSTADVTPLMCRRFAASHSVGRCRLAWPAVRRSGSGKGSLLHSGSSASGSVSGGGSSASGSASGSVHVVTLRPVDDSAGDCGDVARGRVGCLVVDSRDTVVQVCDSIRQCKCSNGSFKLGEGG